MYTAELRPVLQLSLLDCIGFSKSSKALKQETQSQNNTHTQATLAWVKHRARKRGSVRSASYIKIQSAKEKFNVRIMQFSGVGAREGKRIPIGHWQAKEQGSVDEKRACELHKVEGRWQLATFTV